MYITQGWLWHSPGTPRQLIHERLELVALGDRDVLIDNYRIEVRIGSCFVHCEGWVSSFVPSGLRSMEGSEWYGSAI